MRAGGAGGGDSLGEGAEGTRAERQRHAAAWGSRAHEADAVVDKSVEGAGVVRRRKAATLGGRLNMAGAGVEGTSADMAENRFDAGVEGTSDKEAVNRFDAGVERTSAKEVVLGDANGAGSLGEGAEGTRVERQRPDRETLLGEGVEGTSADVAENRFGEGAEGTGVEAIDGGRHAKGAEVPFGAGVDGAGAAPELTRQRRLADARAAQKAAAQDRWHVVGQSLPTSRARKKERQREQAACIAAEAARVSRRQPARVAAARAATAGAAGAPPCSLHDMIAIVREKRARPKPVKPVTFNRSAALARSAQAAQGTQIKYMVLGQQQERRIKDGLGMDAALLRAGLAEYPDIHRVLSIAVGAALPIDPQFRQVVTGVKVQRMYIENNALVNGTLSEDELAHGVLLFTERAFAQFVAEGGSLSPFGVAFKRTEPDKARLTANCSAPKGRSVNDATGDDRLDQMYGPAPVDPLRLLCIRVCQQADDEPALVPSTSECDAKGAFHQFAWAPGDAVKLAGAVVDKQCPDGEEPITIAVPTWGNFGYKGCPAIWHVLAFCATWIMTNAPLDWYRHGFKKARIRKRTTTADDGDASPGDAGEPRRRHALCVDDCDIVARDRLLNDWYLASYARALEYLFCPDTSLFSGNRTCPDMPPLPVVRRGMPTEGAPPPMSFHKGVVSEPKLVRGAEAAGYMGWRTCAATERVYLAPRGFERVVAVLWEDLAPGVTTISRDLLASCLGCLQHYSVVNGMLQPFLSELWRLLYATPTATMITLSKMAIADLKMWREVIAEGFTNPTVTSFDMREYAGVFSPNVFVGGDAGGFGGGGWWSLAGFGQMTHGTKWRWSRLEKEASASYHDGDVDANLLELAALVVLTLNVGLIFPGACLEYAGDNVVSLAWATKMRSKNRTAAALIKALAWGSVALGLRLVTSWTAGVDNTGPDCLSRWDEAERRATFAKLTEWQPVQVSDPDPAVRAVVQSILEGASEELWRPALIEALQNTDRVATQWQGSKSSW